MHNLLKKNTLIIRIGEIPRLILGQILWHLHSFGAHVKQFNLFSLLCAIMLPEHKNRDTKLETGRVDGT